MTSTDPISEAAKGVPATFYAVPVVLTALAAAFYSRFWLSHDDSWYLVATRKFLDGQQLYVDIMEVNPPLNFYLTAPALLFADLTGLSDTAALVLQTCVLCGLSGLWVLRLLRKSDVQQAAQGFTFATCLGGLFLLPMGELAQREHMLLIFGMPYLTYAIIGRERIGIGKAEAFLLGLVATLGFALKPYFLLIATGIVLAGPFKGVMSRTFAPANLGLATGLVWFAAFTIIVHPEFFSDILQVARKIYWVYGEDSTRVLFRQETVGLFLFTLLLFHRGFAGDPVSLRYVGAGAGALASYLIQFKGWDYQILPLSYFLMAGAGWLAVRKEIFSRREAAPAVLVLLVVCLTLGKEVAEGPYRPASVDAFTPFVQHEGETIMVYSTNVYASFPFVNAVGGRWASRYPAQWTIPGALIATRRGACLDERAGCSEYEAILADARSANTEDFLRYRPDLVFVDMRDEKSYFHGEDFDYLDFQLVDARFSEAWMQYRMVGRVGEAYAVWRRREGTE